MPYLNTRLLEAERAQTLLHRVSFFSLCLSFCLSNTCSHFERKKKREKKKIVGREIDVYTSLSGVWNWQIIYLRCELKLMLWEYYGLCLNTFSCARVCVCLFGLSDWNVQFPELDVSFDFSLVLEVFLVVGNVQNVCATC